MDAVAQNYLDTNTVSPPPGKPAQSEIEQIALELIRREKTAWDTGTAFVTDRVAFQMRNVIRLMRKNYWGVFDEPNDPITGKRKIWAPMTEYLVESAAKNINVDIKDVDFRSKNSSAQPLTIIVRQAVRNYLERMNFGELLEMSIRQVAIDGTLVWKTIVETGSDGKRRLIVSLVDLLNWYVDPTVDNARAAESKIERALMTPDEISKMTGWINTKGLAGTNQFNRYDGSLPYVPSTTQGQVKMREVFERWGIMPKFLMTNKPEDKDKQVEGHIVASSMGSDWVIHLIEENKKKFFDGSAHTPYEDFQYTKIHGRYYGKGIAEKLMWLQIYLNTIFNIRKNRQELQQLGLFKIRAGSNITPQMIARLVTTGAIKVTDLDKDIAPLEFPQSGIEESMNDEKNSIDWGQRVTGLFEAATGDQLPASQPATTTAIQSQSAQSQFVLIQKGLGMFLERWIKNHLLPFILQELKQGDVIRLTGEYDEIAQLDEWAVNKELADFIDKATKKGKVVNLPQIEFERARALKRLQTSGKDRFMNIDMDFDATEYDVEIVITNEEINKAVLMQNLTQMLGVVPPDIQEGIVREIFDLVGLDPNQLKSTTPNALSGAGQPQQQQGQQQPQQQQGLPAQMQRAMTQPTATR